MGGYTLASTKAFKDDNSLYAEYRLPMFIFCNGLGFLIIMGWRIVASGSDWVETNALEVQKRLLIHYSFIALLLFVACDTLSLGSDAAQTFRRAEIKEGGIFSDLFLPVFMLVTTQHPLLFIYQCGFVGLACFMMFVTKWFKNVYYTKIGAIVFIGTSVLNTDFAHTAEKSLRSRYKAILAMQLTHERIEHILHTLMPVMVVEDMQRNPTSGCEHHYRKATIAQSDLCGFTKLAAKLTPQEVVRFVGELFGKFDDLTDKHEIYKVETVGDAYIAGQADKPLTYKNSPLSVVQFGLDMVRATHDWARSKGEVVSCRVGVHTGECIGGIVGTEMQRYHLFGNLMTILEVLESTAVEGRVQVSPACKEAVTVDMKEMGIPKEAAMFDERTDPELRTSKGEIHEYSEVGGRTFLVRSYNTKYLMA